MNSRYLFAFTLVACFFSFGTAQDFPSRLAQNYDSFKENTIQYRRFTHSDILPLINKRESTNLYTVSKVGESIEGRSLHLISLGTGDTDVFLWSQMHGDESTATMAVFDILNFFESPEFQEEKERILHNLTIHFLPMVNPDGAEQFQRRNALGVDINRDALRLQSPESKILKQIRDSLQADFGFNLHDQSSYYNVSGTREPATISFLAPAYNYEKEVNDVRERAIKLIGAMNRVLQQYAPGKVGRYNDDFEPRAFGDNMQKWGTSTVLIESGGYPNDPEKQQIRKLNFLAMLTAFHSIATGDYKQVSSEEYFSIPENDRRLFDMKLTGLRYNQQGEQYVIDLGINRREIRTTENDKGYYYRGYIDEKGDLSTYYGYTEKDMTGYTIRQAAVYPERMKSMEEFKKLNEKELLQKGCGYVRIAGEIPIGYSSRLTLLTEEEEPNHNIENGNNPTFFLEKDGTKEFVVKNGFLWELE